MPSMPRGLLGVGLSMSTCSAEEKVGIPRLVYLLCNASLLFLSGDCVIYLWSACYIGVWKSPQRVVVTRDRELW